MHRTAARLWLVSAALVCLLIHSPLARADVAGARKLIDQTKENLRLHSWDDCENNLKLAEAEVDGAPDADKQKVLSEVATIRKNALAARREWDRPGFIESLKRYVESAKSNVTVA